MLTSVQLFRVLLMMASCVAVFAAGVASPAVAHAESRTLKKARRAFDNYEFENIVPLLRRALRQTKNAKEQADIYRMLGIVYAAQSQKAQAKKAFLMALERQPTLDLGPNPSPQVREPFAAALKEFKARRPALAKKASPAAEVETPATTDVAAEATALKSEPPTEPPTAPPAQVVDGAPSRATPTVEVVDAQDVATEPPASPLSSPPPPKAPARGGFYRQWWFWSAAAAVAGTSAGVSAWLMLRQPEPASDFGPYRVP